MTYSSLLLTRLLLSTTGTNIRSFSSFLDCTYPDHTFSSDSMASSIDTQLEFLSRLVPRTVDSISSHFVAMTPREMMAWSLWSFLPGVLFTSGILAVLVG